jgi:choice-of-anchor C domain-containing protein
MMCVMKGFGLAALSLAMMAGAAGQSMGATIVNGDFEEAGIASPVGFYAVLAGGSPEITGWTVTGHSVEWVEGGFWQASSGRHSIDLSGSAAGGIEQTFATTVGQTYKVSFDLAGDPGAPQTGKSVNVSAGGQSQVFTFDTTGKTKENMGYIPISFAFIAASDSTTLAFTSLESSFAGPVLDNVTVVAAPEPSTFAMSGIALVMLGLGCARRRRQLADA